MSWWDYLALLPLLAGMGFFLSGTVALRRLPDAASRLHAVTKVDTLGVGLVALGLLLRTPELALALKLLLCWLLVLLSGSTACCLVIPYAVARSASGTATPATGAERP